MNPGFIQNSYWIHLFILFLGHYANWGFSWATAYFTNENNGVQVQHFWGISRVYSGWNAPPHFINYSLSAPSAVVASPLMHNLLIRAASKSLIGEEWCQQMEKTRGIFGFFSGFFFTNQSPVMKKGGSTLNSKAWLNSAIKINE